jgi:hypothetical protein
MLRKYKLAANFNTVEIEIGDCDIEELRMDKHLNAYYPSDIDEDSIEYVDEEEFNIDVIKRALQREYDILSGIKVVNIAPDIKKAPAEPASAKQIEWARNLGMKNPANATKQEVWEYIQKHR